MAKINIRKLKSKSVLDLLLKTDKRRKHSLYLASCYFSEDAAAAIINEIRKAVNLSNVIVYIDRKTALLVGKERLVDFCGMFDGLAVELYAVATSYLFHTKAYALVSFEGDDDVYCGSLVVGSANLTSNGMTGKNGNIESILDSQDLAVLTEFLDQTNSLNLIEIQEIDRFKKAEDFDFKYALIQEGCFIHKWNDSLDQYFLVRYHLNRKGRDKLENKDLSEIGFNMDTATISKKYFNFEYEAPHLEGAENLTRNYGIETHLGYWIPKSALDQLFEKNQLDNFKNELQAQFIFQIEDIQRRVQDDLTYLKAEELIHVTDSDPVDLLKNKFDDLLKNEQKIMRIYSKYEVFSLPYDISQKENIVSLFRDMYHFVESKKRKNLVMKAFLDAISSVSLNSFRDKASKNII